VRVESICNSLFNLSASECLAESLKNVCEHYACSFEVGFKSPESPDCSPLGCTAIECSDIEVREGNRLVGVPGTFTDFGFSEPGFLTGSVTIEGNIYDINCGLVVE